VPMDDEHTMFWNGRYSPTRAMTEDERARPGTTGYSEYQPPTTQPLTNWRLKTTLANNYFMDYEAQRNRRRFSGIPPVKPQDVAMTESMGPIMDRTREHLGTSDAAIIQMRRCIINAAKALRDRGVTPTGVDDPDAYAVHSGSVVLPRDADWVAETRRALQAASNLPLLYV